MSPALNFTFSWVAYLCLSLLYESKKSTVYSHKIILMPVRRPGLQIWIEGVNGYPWHFRTF